MCSWHTGWGSRPAPTGSTLHTTEPSTHKQLRCLVLFHALTPFHCPPATALTCLAAEQPCILTLVLLTLTLLVTGHMRSFGSSDVS